MRKIMYTPYYFYYIKDGFKGGGGGGAGDKIIKACFRDESFQQYFASISGISC